MTHLIMAVVVLAQAVYWLWLKPQADELEDKYWDACVHPGKDV